MKKKELKIEFLINLQKQELNQKREFIHIFNDEKSSYEYNLLIKDKLKSKKLKNASQLIKRKIKFTSNKL